MARIKAEVREHAHQQRRARQHHPANAAPSYAPPAPAPAPVVVKTEVGVSLLPPQDPPVVAPAGGRCIDLTADEETEDEEDTDEPFATDLQRIRNQEHEQERKDEQDDGEASPMELETDAEDEEVSKATAPRAAMAHDATDESDVDEEMPTPQVRSADEGADPVSKDASPRVGVSGGVRAVVDKIGHALLNAVMPSLSRSGAPAPSAAVENDLEAETPMAQGAKRDAVAMGGEDAENDEEEEDERWPELQSREAEREDDVGDDDRDSTGSETAESSVEARQATVGSLEDGEIFEEGAVVKSPTAVKEAIAQELEAARAAAQAAMAKKKQKKRGRKKNKRKVEVMLTAAPVEEVDEFGRNLRHQPMMPRPMSVVQSSHMQPFLPSMAMSLPTQTSVHAPPPLLPLPPLMTTPPHPPPVPQPPQLPVPMHEYGKPHAPQQFLDDQIVRVNRHGGFEPFALHGNSRGPRPPIAPPFSQPPPLAPPTGFRYVSMDHFRPEGTGAVGEGSPNRGLKRPHQPSKQGVDDEPAFDLDSLRAAALKTKRKLAKETQTAAPIDPPTVTAAAPDPSADTSSATDGAAEEGEGDLDALRMELLKSMRRRRREPSGQSTSSVTESVDDTSSGKSSGSNRVEPEPSPINTPAETARGKPTATASLPLVMETRKQEHAVENRLTSSTLPELASPPLRPLTAVSQTCVIRFSLDDLSLDEQKSRANSFDDAAARYEKVVQDVRAKAVSAKLTDVTQRTEPHGPIASASKATTTTEEQSSVVAARTGASTTRTADTSVDAAELTAQESTTRAEAEANGVDKTEKVLPTTTRTVVVDPEVLAGPVRLEAERQACLANIREADANIARLDAEIAALRHALAAREADSQSSVTACGA